LLGETKKKQKQFSEGTYDGHGQVCILKDMKIIPKQNVTGLIMPSGLARKSVVEYLCVVTLPSSFFFGLIISLCACLYIVYTYASITSLPYEAYEAVFITLAWCIIFVNT